VDLAWARDSPGRSRFQTAAAAPEGSRGQWGGAAEVRERRGPITGFRHASSSPTCFAQFQCRQDWKCAAAGGWCLWHSVATFQVRSEFPPS